MKIPFCGQVQAFRHLVKFHRFSRKKDPQKEVRLQVTGRGTEYHLRMQITAGSLVKYLCCMNFMGYQYYEILVRNFSKFEKAIPKQSNLIQPFIQTFPHGISLKYLLGSGNDYPQGDQLVTTSRLLPIGVLFKLCATAFAMHLSLNSIHPSVNNFLPLPPCFFLFFLTELSRNQ